MNHINNSAMYVVVRIPLWFCRSEYHRPGDRICSNGTIPDFNKTISFALVWSSTIHRCRAAFEKANSPAAPVSFDTKETGARNQHQTPQERHLQPIIRRMKMHENVCFHYVFIIPCSALTPVRWRCLQQMLSPQGGRGKHTKTQKIYRYFAWEHGRHHRKDAPLQLNTLRLSLSLNKYRSHALSACSAGAQCAFFFGTAPPFFNLNPYIRGSFVLWVETSVSAIGTWHEPQVSR